MGTIKKVNADYYVEFYARGLLYAQYAGQDLQKAKDLLAQIESKINQGEALTVVRDIPWDVFRSQSIMHLKENQTPKTVLRFEGVLAHFSGYINKDFPNIVNLSQITPHVIESYKRAHQHASAKRVNFSILLLREVLDHGIRLGFIHDNPTLFIKLNDLPKHRYAQTARAQQVQQLIAQHASLLKMVQILNLSDVGTLIYFVNLFPKFRDEMYN